MLASEAIARLESVPATMARGGLWRSLAHPPPLIMYLGVVPQVLGTLILGTFLLNVPKCGLKVLCAAFMLTWVHFLASLVISF